MTNPVAKNTGEKVVPTTNRFDKSKGEATSPLTTQKLPESFDRLSTPTSHRTRPLSEGKTTQKLHIPKVK